MAQASRTKVTAVFRSMVLLGTENVMQSMIRLCQQEKSIDNYRERDIVGLQCINPSLQI